MYIQLILKLAYSFMLTGQHLVSVFDFHCFDRLYMGWMDDFRFYVLFNSISVISG